MFNKWNLEQSTYSCSKHNPHIFFFNVKQFRLENRHKATPQNPGKYFLVKIMVLLIIVNLFRKPGSGVRIHQTCIISYSYFLYHNYFLFLTTFPTPRPLQYLADPAYQMMIVNPENPNKSQCP